MKKISFILLYIFLIIGCSKSSSDEEILVQNPVVPVTPVVSPPANVLLQRTETTTNGVTTNNYYYYNGNKIDAILNYYTIYAHGNTYYYTGSNTTLISYAHYEAPLNKDISYIYSSNNILLGYWSWPSDHSRLMTNFTYNSDSSINYNQYLEYWYTPAGQMNPFTTTIGTGKYTFLNGNLIKDEFIGNDYNEITNYTYDTKNKPTKNILNYALIFDNDGTISVNNLTSINKIRNNTPTGGQASQINTLTNYTYTYNSDNYPISSVKTIIENGVTTTTSSINYFY